MLLLFSTLPVCTVCCCKVHLSAVLAVLYMLPVIDPQYIVCDCTFLAQVYPEFFEIVAHTENAKLPPDVKQDVADIFRERWDKMHSPVAHMLEPQFQTTNLGSAT